MTSDLKMATRRRKSVLKLVKISSLIVNKLKAALGGVTGVEGIAMISDVFGTRQTGNIAVLYNKDQKRQLDLAYYFVDQNIIPIMDLKLTAGENFPPTTEENINKYLIINEKAVGSMGFKTNVDAIGKSVWIQDTAEAIIKGVVADFYFRNPGIHIQPMALINNSSQTNSLILNVSSGNKGKLVEDIRSVWRNTVPQEDFSYSWYNKYLEEKGDQTATYSLLGFLAFTAVSIASLGLLGLVVYTTETRRKEVSIRKVMVANIRTLILTLSQGFIKLLLMSGIIAMPIGYILSIFFLQNFPSRIEFGAFDVILCFAFLMGLGLFTILTQTWKASAESPARNLRME